MEKVAAIIGDLGGQCLRIPVGPENEMVRDKALEMLVESVRNETGRIVEEMKQILDGGEELTKRKAQHRWRELSGQLDRIKMFARR